jgi:UrcA family protein
MDFGTNGRRAGIAALVAGLVVSQGALAAGGLETTTQSKTINVASLNLSSQAGAEVAYKRIAATAMSICSKTLDGLQGVDRLKEQRQTVQPCFDAAVKDALDQVTRSTGINLTQVAGLDRNRLVAER